MFLRRRETGRWILISQDDIRRLRSICGAAKLTQPSEVLDLSPHLICASYRRLFRRRESGRNEPQFPLRRSNKQSPLALVPRKSPNSARRLSGSTRSAVCTTLRDALGGPFARSFFTSIFRWIRSGGRRYKEGKSATSGHAHRFIILRKSIMFSKTADLPLEATNNQSY